MKGEDEDLPVRYLLYAVLVIVVLAAAAATQSLLIAVLWEQVRGHGKRGEALLQAGLDAGTGIEIIAQRVANKIERQHG